MFRLSTRADPAFLFEMLYEAVYWRDDDAEERPPLESVVANPAHARYVEGWGRAGDAAVIAFDRNEEPIGAVWSRRFPAGAPGYGFVAEDIPELAIGVYSEFRHQGVGNLLLGSHIAHARAAGERALSLSVERDNPSRRLYARNGFVVQHAGEGADTMLLVLTPPA